MMKFTTDVHETLALGLVVFVVVCPTPLVCHGQIVFTGQLCSFFGWTLDATFCPIIPFKDQSALTII